jgi:DNA-binding GntR family transcriptional regulator
MATAPRKLAPRATTEQVYQDLHGRIVRGDLRPGDALTETRVGDSYGISRTPVREVFWRLSEEGLLRVIPQVGTFVAPINIPAVHDSQFVRETLECRAVADAARRAEAGDVSSLWRLVEEQTQAIAAGDFARFFAHDEHMHRLLMDIAGHPFVWPVIASAKAQLDRVRFLSLADETWPGMIMAQHRRIVSLVAAHDAAGAVDVMTAHLRTAFAAIGRIAADNPDFFEGSMPVGTGVRF